MTYEEFNQKEYSSELERISGKIDYLLSERNELLPSGFYYSEQKVNIRFRSHLNKEIVERELTGSLAHIAINGIINAIEEEAEKLIIRAYETLIRERNLTPSAAMTEEQNKTETPL